jgi:hypothetical protein
VPSKHVWNSFTVRSFILPFRIYADCSLARYITTAHSSLCSETMSLRGRGKDGSASGACEVPARHEPLGGLGHYEMPTEFQIERYNLATDQLVMTALLPTRFPLCVVTSPGPSDRIGRVGAL